MSHFTVTVRVPAECNIKQVPAAVEMLLAPYQENNMGDCPEEYLEFYDVGEEEFPAWDSGETTLRRFKDPEGNYYTPYGDRFARTQEGDTSPFPRKEYVAPEGWEDLEIPAKELFPDFDKFMAEYHEYEKNEDGKYGYMHNPNAMWDWWVVGGRWRGYYPVGEEALKDPSPRFITGESGAFGNQPDQHTADGIRIGDIDMLKIEQQLDASVEHFWREAEQYFATGENGSPFSGVRSTLLALGFLKCKDEDEITPEERATHKLIKWRRHHRQGVTRYDVFDVSILKRKHEVRSRIRAYLHPLRTFAALDAERGWFSPGKMGWFGTSTDTPSDNEDYAQAFLNWVLNGNQKDWLVVVDCHI